MFIQNRRHYATKKLACLELWNTITATTTVVRTTSVATTAATTTSIATTATTSTVESTSIYDIFDGPPAQTRTTLAAATSTAPTATAPPAVPATPAFTGSSSAALAGFALALTLGGTALVWTTRRRGDAKR